MKQDPSAVERLKKFASAYYGWKEEDVLLESICRTAMRDGTQRVHVILVLGLSQENQQPQS